MAKTELTIILPGLASIVGQQINAEILPENLSKIIKKSGFEPDVTGLARIIFNLFSETSCVDSDLPVACLLNSSSTVIKADPCYLHPDRDRLLLFADNLLITEEESIALIAEIQPLLEEFTGTLTSLQPDSWLLELATMPNLKFSALPEVSGKGIETHLPQGDEQSEWIRLWNEIQMQLYDADVNQQRVMLGKLPINSVWFWGAGRFIPKENVWDKVQGNSPLLQQITQRSGIKLNLAANWSVNSLSSGKHLWVLDEIDLEADWQQQLEQVDEHILYPLWQQLRETAISTITLRIPEYGAYRLTPLDSWKFWK